ncbi:hypothetical protein M5K25_012207 [Dendrobium thyrsiflorum]|uniref:Uncharacterized protein n=1 Tax=Dendrobium thyrsiflorum TaxID=117978 RepID=A0ABD0UWV6_DENTH
MDEKYFRMEGKFTTVEGMISSIKNCFENLEYMMKKLIEMQSKASQAIPKADLKGKKIQEDDDEVESVFSQEPSLGDSDGRCIRVSQKSATRWEEAKPFWRPPGQEGRWTIGSNGWAEPWGPNQPNKTDKYESTIHTQHMRISSCSDPCEEAEDLNPTF